MALFLKYAVLLLGFILQTTVISNLNIFGLVSNLFLVILLYAASRSTVKESIIFGTTFGVLTDFVCAKIFGINTALTLILCILVSFISNRMRNKNLVYYLVIAFLFTGLYEYISSVLLVGSSIHVTLGYVFLRKVIPTALFNTVWMIPTYFWFRHKLSKLF